MTAHEDWENWAFYADTITGRDKLAARTLEEAIAFVQKDKWLRHSTKRIVKISREVMWTNEEFKRG